MTDITTESIKQWSKERNLHNADPYKQLAKLIEETGELAECMNKNSNEEDTALELGDIYVVITILAQQLGLDIGYCKQKAYDKIINRKGKTINGVFVKEGDL